MSTPRQVVWPDPCLRCRQPGTPPQSSPPLGSLSRCRHRTPRTIDGVYSAGFGRAGRGMAGLGWARRGTAWQGEAGMATKRVCSVAGCPQLTDGGRCDDHTRAAEQQRGSAHTRGYDAKWRRTRHRYLSAHPLCCEPDCPQLATDVDHIDGLGPNGPRGHDPTNLRAYCHPHHSQRTARDQPGGYTAMN